MSFPRISDVLMVAVPQRPAPKGAETEAAGKPAPVEHPSPARGLAVEERSKIAERLQDLARASGRALEFRVDEASDRVVISVRDERTGELIRQIPDETALRIAQRLEAKSDEVRSMLIEDKG
jgi:flagellar protein FlaG